MINWLKSLRDAALIAIALVPSLAFGQMPALSTCVGSAKVPACDAVRGDRADGWRAQSRAEVMAPHGMVTTSQPLAAQAGLQIMRQGGNRYRHRRSLPPVVLNYVVPLNTGVGGDLFAIIYVAKEKKLYVLDASGMAPSGATVARYNALGYRADPENWGPGSGMPGRGILTVTVPGSAWGWDEALARSASSRSKRCCSRPSITPKTDSRSLSVLATIGISIRAAAYRLMLNCRSGFGLDMVCRRQAAGRRSDFPQSRSRQDLAADAIARPRWLLQGRSGAGDRGEVECARRQHDAR